MYTDYPFYIVIGIFIFFFLIYCFYLFQEEFTFKNVKRKNMKIFGIPKKIFEYLKLDRKNLSYYIRLLVAPLFITFVEIFTIEMTRSTTLLEFFEPVLIKDCSLPCFLYLVNVICSLLLIIRDLFKKE